MFASIKNGAVKLPIINRIVSERNRLRAELLALKHQLRFAPPGHFNSPLPSVEEIQRDESLIFGKVPRKILGLELHEEEQLRLLQELAAYYGEMPFQPRKAAGLRYYYENPAYSYSDAIFLHCMIRHLKPARIIEVGSGFSSCMILDTVELFLEGAVTTTFVEPFPELLLSLIQGADETKAKILPQRLQEVDFGEFEALQANDILFIDSTHVSKINSDVNRVLFDILPRLSPGVYVHFHDIFYPFEYPKDWIYEGRAWNEAYLVRAFLQYNLQFRVVLMNSFLANFHEPFFREQMPLCLKNTGASLGLQKQC